MISKTLAKHALAGIAFCALAIGQLSAQTYTYTSNKVYDSHGKIYPQNTLVIQVNPKVGSSSPAHIQFFVEGEEGDTSIYEAVALEKGAAEYAVYKDLIGKTLSLCSSENRNNRIAIWEGAKLGSVKLCSAEDTNSLTCEFTNEEIEEIMRVVNLEVKKLKMKKLQ